MEFMTVSAETEKIVIPSRISTREKPADDRRERRFEADFRFLLPGSFSIGPPKAPEWTPDRWYPLP